MQVIFVDTQTMTLYRTCLPGSELVSSNGTSAVCQCKPGFKFSTDVAGLVVRTVNSSISTVVLGL